MKQLKFSFGLLFLSIHFFSCAQEKAVIKKAVAFSAIHIPGNIPVDENGNSLYKGPETINTIYIETNKTGIQWDKAWKDGNTYTVTATLLPAATFHAGAEKMSGRKLSYTAARGYLQWLLELQPTTTGQKMPLAIKKGEILLSGKYNSKPITQIISQQTELEVLPVY